MGKLERRPALKWYEKQQRQATYWAAYFHGYVCIVNKVPGKQGSTYRPKISYLDANRKILLITGPKNIVDWKKAIEWCATTLATEKYLPQRRTLRWREPERGQSWTAYEHGYVCCVDKNSREGYTVYWPSIFFLRTSSDIDTRNTLRPLYTLRGAQFWCADYLAGHGVYKGLPEVSVQRTSWYWAVAFVVFILFLAVFLASNSR